MLPGAGSSKYGTWNIVPTSSLTLVLEHFVALVFMILKFHSMQIWQMLTCFDRFSYEVSVHLKNFIFQYIFKIVQLLESAWPKLVICSYDMIASNSSSSNNFISNSLRILNYKLEIKCHIDRANLLGKCYFTGKVNHLLSQFEVIIKRLITSVILMSSYTWQEKQL